MAYEKQNFQDGTVLTADNLNHIEDGIATVSEDLAAAIGDIATTLDRIADLQESYMSTAELDNIIALEEDCIGGDA